jgi:hypothetical protein
VYTRKPKESDLEKECRAKQKIALNERTDAELDAEPMRADFKIWTVIDYDSCIISPEARKKRRDVFKKDKE